MTADYWPGPEGIDYHADGAGSVCEDLVNASEHGAWVLDGSSGAERAGITDAASDGRWYVDRFDDALQRRLGSDARLPDIARRCVEEVSRDYRRFEGTEDVSVTEQPLAAGAVVHATEESLEFLLSADCDLVVRRRSGEIEVFFGDGPRKLDAALLDEIRRRKREEGLSHEQARAETRELIVENRRQLNTPGGYWAFSLDDRSADHARGSTLDPTTVDRVALFSDGFERLFENYEALSYAGLFDLVDAEGIQSPIERLRDIEQADPDCRRYPRVKPSDDAALAVVDLPDS